MRSFIKVKGEMVAGWFKIYPYICLKIYPYICLKIYPYMEEKVFLVSVQCAVLPMLPTSIKRQEALPSQPLISYLCLCHQHTEDPKNWFFWDKKLKSSYLKCRVSKMLKYPPPCWRRESRKSTIWPVCQVPSIYSRIFQKLPTREKYFQMLPPGGQSSGGAWRAVPSFENTYRRDLG